MLLNKESERLCRELGDGLGEAAAWDSLGYIYGHADSYTEAVACHQRAIELTVQLGGRYHQADALTHLGSTHHTAGNLPSARQVWRQALAILDELGHPDASQVRARLMSLGQPGAQLP